MAMKGGAGNAQAGSLLLVVHDFQARSPDELSLAKGDRIELIERDDDFGDGWFLGKHLTNGSSGLFPEVYTTPAPKGTLTNSSHRHRSSDATPVLAAQAAAASMAMSTSTSGGSTGSRNATATQSLPPAAAGAPNPMAAAALRVSLPSNGAAGGRNFTVASDSPVMSETLSVIDEHITDMKSPRASYVPNGSKRDTMGSVYSAQHPYRRSYIAGTETDEEEHQLHTEQEVMSWGPERVAEYLEDSGVESAHCDVFRDQEISGEVLLAMDQNSLFIKEFELGAIGRRLRTWHKIKGLQDEVKRSGAPSDLVRERSASEYSLGADAAEGATDPNVPRSRSSTIGTPSLPRGLSTAKRQSGDSIPTRSTTLPEQQMSYVSGGTRRVSAGMSPLQAMTSASREGTHRPSAQGIRNLNHSRRHSSIDSTSTDGATRMGHRKKPSLDQRWEPGQSVNGGHKYTASTDLQFTERKSSTLSPASLEELDRGYFSSTEVDARSRRPARNSAAIGPSTMISPMDSRAGSLLTAAPELREPVSPIGSSSHHISAMNAINSKFGGYRSATAPSTNSKLGLSNPIVTKLDYGSSQSKLAASPTKIDDNASEASSDRALPTTPAERPSPRINMGMFSSARVKMTGLRSSSDAVTKDEKRSPTKTEASLKSPTRTGSSTPSTEGKSFDLSKSDIHSRASTGSAGGLLPPPPAKRPRAKTKAKKATSAYTRGLEQKTPQEAMITCDYSGWMKKKSGSLMTTWKTRLFILRGCRLSYYYSDDDTEEKGLIDISFHRVLPAHNETLTGLHATVTGASGGPTSPAHGSTPTLAQQDLRNNPPQKGEEREGMFIFKLVPPKAGLSKGVNFTKPAVHYFAVNSRQEGRLWMAALMKATIDRDDNGVVTTTYNQKTISLQKARERRERPPALKEEGVDISIDGIAELPANDNHDTGLGINGLNGDQDSTLGGAHEDGSMLDGSSIAPSTTADSELDLAERQAVASNM